MDVGDRVGPDWRLMEDEGFAVLIGGVEHDFSDPTAGRFRFRTGPQHANRNGYVHGGLLMTVADHALGLSARQGDTRLAHATVSFTMTFVSAVEPGSLLELECRVVRARRTLVFMEGTLRTAGETVATCTGVWKRFHRDS